MVGAECVVRETADAVPHCSLDCTWLAADGMRCACMHILYICGTFKN